MKWSDNQPLTADDVAWTFNAVKTNRDPPAGQRRRSSATSRASTRQGRPDPGDDADGAAGVEPRVRAADRARSTSGRRSADPSKYANDTDTVGSGPFVLRSRTSRAASGPARRQPELLARRSRSSSGLTYVVLQEHRRRGAGAQDRARSTSSGCLTAPSSPRSRTSPGSPPTPAQGRRYIGLAHQPRRDRRPTGKPSVTATPRCRTRGPAQAIRQAIDIADLLDRVLPGPGQAGAVRHPGRLPAVHWICDGYTPPSSTPRGPTPLLDAGRLRQGRRRHPQRQVRQAAQRCACWSQLRPDRTRRCADFVKGWLKADRHRPHGQHGRRRTRSTTTPPWASTTCTSPAGASGPTRTSSSSINPAHAPGPTPTAPAPPARTTGATPRSTRSTRQQHAELDPTKRAELVKQAFTRSTRPRSTASTSGTPTRSRPGAATSSPASSRARERWRASSASTATGACYGATPVSADSLATAATERRPARLGPRPDHRGVVLALGAVIVLRCGVGPPPPTRAPASTPRSEPSPSSRRTSRPRDGGTRRVRAAARPCRATSRARPAARCISLAMVVVLGFFSFRILPGDPTRLN